MNILLINVMETTAPGGINTTVRETAKYISLANHCVTVLQANSLNLRSEEILNGFKIIRVNSNFEKYLFGINPAIYRYLKDNLKLLSPDIIHVHGIHSLLSSEAIFTIRIFDKKTPIVFSPYLDISRSTFLGKYLWDHYLPIIGIKSFKKVNHVISCSNFEADNINCIFGVSSNNISIIPLGVDTINLTKPIKSNSQINLIYSGYLIKRKSVNHILNGLYSLINDYNIKNVILKIIGDGPEKKNVINMIKSLNLEDHVIVKSFLPRDEHISELKKADILLLLSESEAYGIVVAETLAQGTPCIVSNNTALREFTCESGCYGIDYPPDPRKLAQLILNVYRENPKVGPFSNKIRTWNKVSLDYISTYVEIINNNVSLTN